MSQAFRRFGLISDTHGKVHRAIHERFAGVEAIYHAGDVGEGVLEELSLIAPVVAVIGNTDAFESGLPEERVEEAPFGRVAIAHGHLFSPNTDQRIRELYFTYAKVKPRLILTGHSHEQRLALRDGCWLVNPGAAGRARFATTPGAAILSWQVESNLISVELFTFR